MTENDDLDAAELVPGDSADLDIDALVKSSSFGTDAVQSLRNRATPSVVKKILRRAKNLAAASANLVGTPVDAAGAVPSSKLASTPIPPLRVWCGGRSMILESSRQEAQLAGAFTARSTVIAGDVWDPLGAHVDGLNDAAADTIMAGFREITANVDSLPLGIAIIGRSGSGKSHTLRYVRELVQQEGGYFFLACPLYGRDFWQNIVHAVITGLLRPDSTGRIQLATMVSRLADKVGSRDALTDDHIATPTSRDAAEFADKFVVALQRLDRRIGIECQHTARALLLLAADNTDAQDIGQSYLLSLDEATPGERTAWGIPAPVKSAHEVARELSTLVALTGPSVLAVDELDTLIAQYTARAGNRPETSETIDNLGLLKSIANGLIELTKGMTRTVTVLACRHHSWDLVKNTADHTFGEHYFHESSLDQVVSPETASALVAEHVGNRLRRVQGFTPPYPTWPVLPNAFINVSPSTPRTLLTRVDQHISACLDRGELTELITLTHQTTESATRRRTRDLGISAGQLAALDALFAELVATADPSPALDPKTEDEAMPELLKAGLRAWVEEHATGHAGYSLDPTPAVRPAFHVRLRRVLDEETEDEMHWVFRSIASRHYLAVLSRLERLRVCAGMDPTVDRRRAFLLRGASWPAGPRVQRALREFATDGGIVLTLDHRDLRVFTALEEMLTQDDPAFVKWLQRRRPASRTALFQAAFGKT